nr:mechanosensitive ion channel protein 2, chloroplastic-like [Tanacetum cinerariifolium]
MDLLRVISHHRARLATPIRTVQRIYRDADIDDVPFSDIFTNNRAAANRPFLLMEPSYKVNGEDKNKSTSRPTSNPEEKDSKPVNPVVISDPVADPNPKLTPEVRTSNVGPTASSSSSSTNSKLEGEKPLTQRSALEDNIILGVALEGSKRMLPIEDNEMGSVSSPTVTESSKEMASCLNGSGGSTTSNNKDQKDDKASLGPGSTQSEQREQEKR